MGSWGSLTEKKNRQSAIKSFKRKRRRYFFKQRWPKKRAKAESLGRELPKHHGYNLWFKKRKGEHRKRKKKLTKKIHKYLILYLHNNRPQKIIGKFDTLPEVDDIIDDVLLLNKSIIFPQETFRNSKGVVKANIEYLLLRKKTNGDNELTYLPNDIGYLVPHKTNDNSNYNILRKIPVLVEDTFKIWCRDGKQYSKTFIEIWDDIIIKQTEHSLDFKRIIIFKNKIIIHHEDNDVDIILFRCVKDSIRFYNLLSEYKLKKRLNTLLLNGRIYNKFHPLYDDYFNLIKMRTGWLDYKIKKTLS